MLRSFPHYQQLDSMDCGPSCLRMIAKFYGRVYSIQNLREKAFITRGRGLYARYQRGGGGDRVPNTGRADHGGGIGKGMSPTLHTALEPMAFRGLLQDKEREVLHSGPGGGTYHLYEGGVQAVLGQYQGGRAGYRDGALAGTGAGVLRDGGRGERQET